MTWETTFYYLPQYKHVSCNQHGDRFKKTGSKAFRIARLTCKIGNETDISRLILLTGRNTLKNLLNTINRSFLNLKLL